MSEQPRVLIVEQDENDVPLLVRALRAGGIDPTWEQARTPVEMRAAMAAGPWDLVIAEHQHSWPGGVTPLAILEESGLDVPIILVSESLSEAAAVELIRAGASDVLRTDRLRRLPLAVHREMRDARVRRERRDAELAMRRTEERYRRLFDGAGDAVFVVEKRSGRYLDANRAAEQLTGRTAHQLRELTTADVTPHGAQQRLDVAALTSGTRDLGEVDYVRPDGTVRVALLSIVPLDENSVYGIAHDITDRKHDDLARQQAAGALRRSEEELTAIFRAAPTGIGVVRNRVFASVNARMCEMTGYAHAEHVGRNTRFLYESDEEYAFVGSEVLRQVAEQGTGSLESRFVRKDGVLVDVLLSWTPLDLSDVSRGITFVLLDITERKRAEDGLRRLAAAIDQSEEGVVVTDPNGVIEYVNPAFERMTGYAPLEAIHQHTRLLRSGKQDPAVYRELWTTIAAGRTWTGRLVNRRKNGTFYTEDCSISPVFGADGRIERYVATKRDVTVALRMEEDLRQAQRVESVGRLAAGVAHDFNNLLSPILGYSELLLEDLHPSDDRYAQVREIEHAAKRARDVTHQLLAFGRKQTLQIRPLDLNVIVLGIERLLRRTLREDIDLRFDTRAEPCVVLVDTGQADQVLMNLSVNAQDAMPDGGTLTIRVESEVLDAAMCDARPGSTPGRYGVLVVADTGHGMDADTRQRMFEPFFSTKGAHGTGLGLSTVYGIVKQHGGYIAVDSEPGSGTVFRVYLPSTDAIAVGDGPSPPVAEFMRGSETILLVEDNEGVRQLVQTVLRREGYTILSAAGGDEALEILRRHTGQLDLVLTDVIMPGMDGRKLFLQVSRQRPGLKVIYMSGYTDNVIAEHGVLEHDEYFLQKPFSIAVLAAKVREVLEH